MAGAEVKYFSGTALEGNAGAEHFTAFKPGHENGFEGFGNGEGLAIHFLVFDLDILAKASGDGMVAVDHPQALNFPRFAPFQRTWRAHQLAENLGEVAGMQDDEPHALPNALLHAFNDSVADCPMDLVAPPEQDIGVFQPLFSQAVFRHVLGCDLKRNVLGPIKGLGNGPVNALRIELGHERIGFFVFVFIPDQGADRHYFLFAIS